MNAMNGMSYELDTPVTFDLDDTSRDEKVNQFIDWVYREYGEDMYQFFVDNHDAILENKLQHPWGDFPAGMKLSKVLMRQFGMDAEAVRQKLSMLIQSNKVTGKLVLSVHPLDFLSASENNHGWRSCHALDGEYRSGNLSYMLDDCTIMAYLKSDAPDVKLPRFPADVPWNDKKWRCYFFFDWEMGICYAGRQYPFHTDRALELVEQMMRKVKYFIDNPDREYAGFFGQGDVIGHRFHHWGIKGETRINNETFYFGRTKVIVGYDDSAKIVPLAKYVGTHIDAMCFNDLIDSHTYAPYIMRFKGEDYFPDMGVHKMLIGAPTPCACCGDRNADNSDTFICRHCQHTYGVGEEITCTHCGCIIPDEELYEVDGEFWCADCFNNYWIECDNCHLKFYEDNIYEEDGHHYCPACWHNRNSHNHDRT